jgi:hypothetical protein
MVKGKMRATDTNGCYFSFERCKVLENAPLIFLLGLFSRHFCIDNTAKNKRTVYAVIKKPCSQTEIEFYMSSFKSSKISFAHEKHFIEKFASKCDKQPFLIIFQ